MHAPPHICVRSRLLSAGMCVQLPVRALAFSPGGDYALSASSGERQIALWRLAVASAKKRQPSAGLLSLEEPAVRIATAPSISGAPEGSFQASMQLPRVSACHAPSPCASVPAKQASSCVCKKLLMLVG